MNISFGLSTSTCYQFLDSPQCELLAYLLYQQIKKYKQNSQSIALYHSYYYKYNNKAHEYAAVYFNNYFIDVFAEELVSYVFHPQRMERLVILYGNGMDITDYITECY